MSGQHLTPPSHQQLSRRCALFTLVAMSLSIGMGLLAWRPIGLPAGSEVHAAHGINLVLSLPMLLAGVCGWRALADSSWPAALLAPWRWCFGGIVMSAGWSFVYHLNSGEISYLAEQAATAAAFVLLLCACLAERLDARFGSWHARYMALAVVGVAAAASWLGWVLLDQMDMRPVWLLRCLPLLLIPAGVLSLPANHTKRSDWWLILGLYGLAQLLDLGNNAVMGITGGALSGHALMHLCLAGAAAWLAYRASSAAPVAIDDASDVTQANTSLSTSG